MPWEICPWLFQAIASLPGPILLMKEGKEHHLSLLKPIYKGETLSYTHVLMNLCLGARRTTDV